ncbi:MAG: hypothetical protein ACPG7A_03025 [Flavobacteriaceae bacterium]
MEVKEKKSVGRPRKWMDTKKVYTWIDEGEWARAKQDFKKWEDAYEKCKVLTGSDYETLEEYEVELRSNHPDLDKLDIRQLYILEGKDRQEYERAFRELKSVNKPPIDKDHYTVTIPVERAEEYSRHLSIANNFNEIRKTDTTVNVMVLPQLTNNKVVFDVRTGALRVNAYMFTQDYK